MIYTFYSFKGGVGRSMAMANIAEILCRRGLNVLMVDFDLEAPGLERFFDVDDAIVRPNKILERRGVIDLLYSYKELYSLPRPVPNVKQEAKGDSRNDFPSFPIEPLINFVTPKHLSKSNAVF